MSQGGSFNIFFAFPLSTNGINNNLMVIIITDKTIKNI